MKDQGQCGSCWTFSTTGAVEGGHYIHAKKLISLSEQQLVDCVDNGAKGCGGYTYAAAFTWLMTHKPESESSYPYTSGSTIRAGTC